jgi:hypothetical protein
VTNGQFSVVRLVLAEMVRWSRCSVSDRLEAYDQSGSSVIARRKDVAITLSGANVELQEQRPIPRW